MVAKTEAEPGEQQEMFPELTDSKEDKAILKAARAYHKAWQARKELLDGAKEDEDTKNETLCRLMHERGLTKFRHAGMEVEIKERTEKARVKLATDDAGEDE